VIGETSKRALVIGGGLAGIEAAIRMGEAGHEVLLIDKEPSLGGIVRRLYRSFPKWEDPRELLDAKLEQLAGLEDVKVLLSTEVVASARSRQGFSVRLRSTGEGEEPIDSTVKAAAIVLATGFELFDAKRYGEYGYGIYPGVVTGLEFEELLGNWSKGYFEAEPPKSIAFIKCVGSRDRVKGHPYCSKICCMYTAKQAGLARDLLPDAKCFVFYMDYRAAGRGYEEFVREVIEERQVRYVRGRPSKVLPSNGRLLIRAEDTLMGVPVEVEADLVVLATATEPSGDAVDLARLFYAEVDEDGFLEPESGSGVRCGPRVFLAGGSGFAVNMTEALQQGAAAAAEVIGLFRTGAGLSGVEPGGGFAVTRVDQEPELALRPVAGRREADSGEASSAHAADEPTRCEPLPADTGPEAPTKPGGEA
jgi:heterodisulfide reductase subunit A2